MELQALIEAMLFVAEDPIPVTEIAEVLERPQAYASRASRTSA